MMNYRSFFLSLFILLASNPPVESAKKDRRYALLVGNQVGWKQEPFLKYVVSGDLQPLSKLLSSFGFNVKMQINRGPSVLRKHFQLLLKQAKQGKIDTFILFYTGHADKDSFHMGNHQQSRFYYRELARFLKQLPVKRKYVIVDACFSGELIRQFGSFEQYKELVRKGASAIRPIDLRRQFSNQGEEKGLKVIASSLENSWESKKLKASMFTHFLLQGLRGKSDLNHDGKITMEELFDFVSNHMKQKVRQKPQFFGFFHRGSSYAIAPAYHSRIVFPRSVLGTLYLKVGNFVWKKRKWHAKRIQVATISGKGFVELHQDEKCFQQDFLVPKGGVLQIGDNWKSIDCSQSIGKKKGVLQLQAQLPKEQRRSGWKLTLEGGGLLSPFGGELPLLGGLQLGFQRRFWGMSMEFLGSQAKVGTTTFPQVYTRLSFFAGYPLRWKKIALFLGGSIGSGLLTQMTENSTNTGFLFHYGLFVRSSFRLTERASFLLTLRPEFVLGSLGEQLTHTANGLILLGFSYHL